MPRSAVSSRASIYRLRILYYIDRNGFGQLIDILPYLHWEAIVGNFHLKIGLKQFTSKCDILSSSQRLQLRDKVAMAAYLPDLTKDNVSFYAIPAMWAVSITPRLYSSWLYQKNTNTMMDMRAPREFSKTASNDSRLHSDIKGRICRAEAAQANGFENIGLFAAAVVAGNVAKLSTLR